MGIVATRQSAGLFRFKLSSAWHNIAPCSFSNDGILSCVQIACLSQYALQLPHEQDIYLSITVYRDGQGAEGECSATQDPKSQRGAEYETATGAEGSY